MKRAILVVMSFLAVCLKSRAQSECNLDVPVITQTSVTACQVSLSWTGDSMTAHYEVRYKEKDSTWQPGVNVGNDTSYLITGLKGGVIYTVQLSPYCAMNQKGMGVTFNIMTLGCSLPLDVKATNVSDTSATISWQNCGGGENTKLHYRQADSVTWKTVLAGNTESVTISGLTKSTAYEYQVKTCSDTGAWSSPSTFITLDSNTWKPNILCIYLDDARYDSFEPNGGPDFFESPAISRIASEGVRFVYAFPALSLCSPSRASIMTGLYPHHHGVYSNQNNEAFPYITVAEILHDAGYYTGFIGKYGYQKVPNIPGFDYYLESSDDLYWNAEYDYNGNLNIIIPGHKTDIITGKALEFLEGVPPGKNFLLLIAHKAPHVPYTPRTADDGIYDDVALPFPDNYQWWTHDIPSSYNDCYSTESDSAQLESQLSGYYELLRGAEDGIDTILQYLEQQNILDSTMVIFTSDNGLMMGEHLLAGKEIALEESIRIPMFIRYPRWFAPGTVIHNEMAMNIDVAPTIIEAAHLHNTFNMDGISMLQLAKHTTSRKELFYEYFYRNSCNPTLTAIRDFSYKYIATRCSEAVEEFYDMVNDPEENNNLINDPAYSDLIEEYREKLEFLKEENDYILAEDSILSCSLENPSCALPCNISAIKKITDVSLTGSCGDGKIKITPLNAFSALLRLELYDNEGELVSLVSQQPSSNPYTFKNLHSGLYQVKVFDSCCYLEINDIRVRCPKPSGFFVTDITSSSATVHWTNQNCNNGYNVQYRKHGTTSWTTKKLAMNTDSYTITGLNANKAYEWSVAVSCLDAEPKTLSGYAATQTFITALRNGENTTESNNRLSLYPNPADETITVFLADGIIQSIQIKDVTGRLLSEEKITGDDSFHDLSVGWLSSGVYMLVIKTNKEILQQSFVK